ncbi:SMP-30/gluconolactonase/LRE family protein [Nocardia crassostreae]|uniref:SMP-30/gluconolactonase/LRE family protein n=1 Tax=Nocardia crassostreae TaxID=53428 RepID=UPI00083022F8|nr:SMP-30/gluconolactonase/LRE family protein [Nocardia crassostreae]
MDTLRAHVCAPPPGRLCEGPVWDPRTRELLWVDIRAGHIHRAEMSSATTDLTNPRTLTLSPPVSAVLPCVSGRLLATVGDTIVRLDGNGDRTPLARLPFPTDHIPRRLNDAKVDPRGRLLAGTMAEDGTRHSAALHRLDPDGTLTTLRTGVSISNGLGWSPDGATLYYADSPTHRIDAFEYDLTTGTSDEGRPFAHFDDGEPDGLTVDSDGCVWTAVWGAGRVRAFDPAGRPRAEIEVGPSQVSSCTFAGPDLDILVITTAAEADAAREPNAGRLFACTPGITGLPMTPFADLRLVHTDDR